jgi:type VI protein secretion system component VasF
MSGWTADECVDARGFTTIRPSDGSANGDTDVEPIATVYREADAPLIAAAPDLLASLQELHAFAAACMRVVVKPEHAACAAALDAEVAAAGIAEGYGIRAQEAIEKATVTHG